MGIASGLDAFFEEFDFDWDALAEEAATDKVVDQFGTGLAEAISDADGKQLRMAIRMSSGTGKGCSEDLRNMIDEFEGFLAEQEEKTMRPMTDSQRAADLLKKGKISDLNSVDVGPTEVGLAKKYCDPYGYPCSAYPTERVDLDAEACAEKAALVADLSSRLSTIKDGLLTAAADALAKGQDYDEPIELLNALSQIIGQLDYTESDLTRFADGEYKDMDGGPIKYTNWPYAIVGVADGIERIIGGLVGVDGFDATAEGLMAVRDMIRAEGSGSGGETEELEDESESGLTASAKRLRTKSASPISDNALNEVESLCSDFGVGFEDDLEDADGGVAVLVGNFESKAEANDFAEQASQIDGVKEASRIASGNPGTAGSISVWLVFDIVDEDKSAPVATRSFDDSIQGLFDLAVDSTSGDSVSALQDARRLYQAGDVVSAADAVYDVVQGLGSLCPQEILDLSTALDGASENTEGLEGEERSLKVKSTSFDEIASRIDEIKASVDQGEDADYYGIPKRDAAAAHDNLRFALEACQSGEQDTDMIRMFLETALGYMEEDAAIADGIKECLDMLKDVELEQPEGMDERTAEVEVKDGDMGFQAKVKLESGLDLGDTALEEIADEHNASSGVYENGSWLQWDFSTEEDAQAFADEAINEDGVEDATFGDLDYGRSAPVDPETLELRAAAEEVASS